MVKITDRVEAGKTIASIARQIGANESIVSAWVNDHRDPRSRPADRRGIVEVVGVAKSPSGSTQLNPGIACDLHLGDMRLSIPAGYLSSHLAEILRALNAGQ